MKSISLLLSVLACIQQTSDCDDGMLMPEDWSGSGYSDILTPALSTEQRPMPTPVKSSLRVPSQTMTIPMTITPLPPSDKPTLLSFLTPTIFIAAVACGAAILVLILMVCLVIVCRKSRRMRNCRSWCWSPCSRRFAKPLQPYITVSFRNSYRGDRESYFIKTDDEGPTNLYTRPGEDDANMEFTAAMFYTPSNLQNVAFNCPKREHQAPGQQTEVNMKETETDFHIQELDALERVLDNALVKFETTTL